MNTLRGGAEHREVWLQIPWYVNDSIEPRHRERIDAHLRDCAPCRMELQQQRAVHAAIAGDAGLEHMPSAALNRLRQRLDADSATQAPSTQTHAAMRFTARQALLAASVAVVAIALTVATVASRHDDRSASLPDRYFTVSSSPPHPAGEIIRAVFAPATTVSQLQRLLDELHLKIIAGPSEAGVYSLAATREQPLAEALTRLRMHQGVRFAEATVPLPARETR